MHVNREEKKKNYDPRREKKKKKKLWLKTQKKKKKLHIKRPWWDSNPQSPAPEADALSIRPQGQAIVPHVVTHGFISYYHHYQQHD